MLFSKANLMVSQVASTDEHAIYTNCVHLNPDGSTVATDGNVMMAVSPLNVEALHIQFPLPRGAVHTTPAHSKGTSVTLELIERAIKNLPKDKRTSLQNVAMIQPKEEGKVALLTAHMQGSETIERNPRREEFPPWMSLFQKLRGNSGTKVCVNRQSLIHLLQAMEEACPDKGGQNPIYLEIDSAGSGIVLRAENAETQQRAIGCITRYNLKPGQWLPADPWERTVFQIQKFKPIVPLGVIS